MNTATPSVPPNEYTLPSLTAVALSMMSVGKSGMFVHGAADGVAAGVVGAVARFGLRAVPGSWCRLKVPDTTCFGAPVPCCCSCVKPSLRSLSVTSAGAVPSLRILNVAVFWSPIRTVLLMVPPVTTRCPAPSAKSARVVKSVATSTVFAVSVYPLRLAVNGCCPVAGENIQ